jgi:hypothetical protein
MNKAPNWLLDFKSNTCSQTGEDGIIAKILDVLPQNDKWCVEFGAWDGRHFSNTCNLIETQGYKAVLIEGNTIKYRDLLENYARNSKVIAVNTFVGFSEKDGLDQILSGTPIPQDFDFLTIDIDGNDYHVWLAISKYCPKVVCIEFNPTIPNEVKFIQAADPSINQGNSLSALVELGKNKGYELVCVLPFNAFFVKAELYPLFKISDNRPEVMRTNLEAVTYLFSGYDGKIFLVGSRKLPWHNLIIRESKIQHLPKFLCKYPLDYTKVEATLFRLFMTPRDFLGSALRRVTRHRKH